MTPQEARNKIYVEYRTVFIPLIGSDHIALDNQDFTPPDDKTKWVRLHVKFNNGSQETLGSAPNRRFTSSGFLYVQCFTRRGSATNENDGLCYDSKAVFEGKDFYVSGDQIWFYDGRIETIGDERGKSPWYQQNVVFEFKFDETK